MTNELTLDMIKVQHWKVYATYYNEDSLGIGLELKKLQFQYIPYEGLGVPIMRDILDRCRSHMHAGVYPYFYDRTTEDEYQSALSIESTSCCVTMIEYAQSKEGVVSVLMYIVQCIHDVKEFIV